MEDDLCYFCGGKIAREEDGILRCQDCGMEYADSNTLDHDNAERPDTKGKSDEVKHQTNHDLPGERSQEIPTAEHKQPLIEEKESSVPQAIHKTKKEPADMVSKDVPTTEWSAPAIQTTEMTQEKTIDKRPEKILQHAPKMFTFASVEAESTKPHVQGLVNALENRISALDQLVRHSKYFTAAICGDADAQYQVAYLYQIGDFDTKGSEADAIRWYIHAAQQGSARAQCEMGWRYQEGLGVLENEEKGKYWCSKAAEQGDPKAQYFLASILMKEENSIDNVAIGELLHKSAMQGYQLAQTSLADAYMYGWFGLKEQPETAAKLYETVAVQKDAYAEYAYAECLKNGYGVENDLEQAAWWYHEAAIQRYAPASLKLADCYRDGVGVIQSDEKAFQWYQKAAEQGNPKAKKELAMCYVAGKGVVQDVDKGIRLMKEAEEALKNNV